MPDAAAIIRLAEELRSRITPENCYRLVDETVTMLEQARAAVADNSTAETRAALMKAHTHAAALTIVATPEETGPEVRSGSLLFGIKSELVMAAFDRLNELPSWEDPLLDEPEDQ
jgi:hypothetical protein